MRFLRLQRAKESKRISERREGGGGGGGRDNELHERKVKSERKADGREGEWQGGRALV